MERGEPLPRKGPTFKVELTKQQPDIEEIFYPAVEDRTYDRVLAQVCVEMPQQGCDSLLFSDALIKAWLLRDPLRPHSVLSRLFH